MEQCLEGKYGEFNTKLWELCQTDPEYGGLTLDQWVDLRAVKFVRQANQAEYARISLNLNQHYPACPRCNYRNRKVAPVCGHCNVPLGSAEKA